MNTDGSFSRRLALLATVVGLAASSPPAAEARDLLSLRVSDARGAPGDVVEVVVRTYAPRGVSQGQICLRATDFGTQTDSSSFSGGPLVPAPAPFSSLDSALVVSALDDAQVSSSLDTTGQVVLVDFVSLSASVNSVDGPLAIFHLHLAESLIANQEFPIEIDPEMSYLLDAAGQPIPLELKAGKLKVRAQ